MANTKKITAVRAGTFGGVKAFYGNFGMMVRAHTDIHMRGAAGLREASGNAAPNANYLQRRLKGTYLLPHGRICMHEPVLEGRLADAPDIRALDISKRPIDHDVHPPTNYFPLIVPKALMIVPTETESKATLDVFADALPRIAEEAQAHRELLHEAPHKAPLGRMDEVRAAWQPR